MERPTKTALMISVTLLLGIALSTTAAGAGELPAWAKMIEPESIRMVGGPHALSRGGIADRDQLRSFFRSHRPEIEQILSQAGWEGAAADLVAAVETGNVSETSLPVDTVLAWMAFRRAGGIGLIHGVRWAGKEPLEVFIVRMASDEWQWTFAIPKGCGNLSLLSKRGTGELIVKVDTGELQLKDPDGKPIVIGAGQVGTVSVSPKALEAARTTGQPEVPATVGVTQGVVEFLAFGGPINLLVEAGTSATARITADGHLALGLPDANRAPMRIKVGDAIGTISPGAGMSADWTPPECRLAVSPASECTPAQVVVDASESATAHGKVETVEITVTKPDGTTIALGSPDSAGTPRWQRSYVETGLYRFSGVAITDQGQRSENSCLAVLEVKQCLPRPPTCTMSLSKTELELYDRLKLDASGSSSESGELEKVIVEVLDEDGKIVDTVELDPPYKTAITTTDSGKFTYRAVAIDRHGQRSELPWQTPVRVHPRFRLTAGTFVGYEQRFTEEGTDRGSLIVAARGGLLYRLRKNLEIGANLGGFVNTDEVEDSGVFADAELNWVGARGFAGVGVGMWDVTNSETSDLTWLLHAGHDTKWEVTGSPVQLFLESRFFPDAPGNSQDNFVFAFGARMRLN